MNTQLVAWFGWFCILSAAIPQILSLRNHHQVNPLTYWFVMVGCLCYFFRAVSIRETVWAVSSAFTVLTSAIILWMIHHSSVRQ